MQVAVALDHLRAGRKDEAISTLRKAMRENPDNVDALHTLAQAYWGNERAHVRHRSVAAPGDGARAGSRVGVGLLGMLLHQCDRPEEAIACYQRAAAIDPDNAVGVVGARRGLRADRRHGEERRCLRAIGRAAAGAARAFT